MHSSRTVIRVPHACRLTRTIPSSARAMSLFPAPFVPRFNGFPSHDFAPLFRILDDYTSQAQRAMDLFPARAAPQVFQPRFDVREVEGAYELRGELPGVEQRQLEVEFTDAQTLVIRGRTERESTTGSPPATLAATSATQQVEDGNANTDATSAKTSTGQINASAVEPAVDSDAVSTHSSSSYQRATVEDEDATNASTPGQATPAESAVAADEPQQTSQANAVATPAPQTEQTQQQQPRYWVSERSVGEFQRTFTFPSRINHDNVRASLKDGVLHIVVPKAVTPASRRINVE